MTDRSIFSSCTSSFPCRLIVDTEALLRNSTHEAAGMTEAMRAWMGEPIRTAMPLKSEKVYLSLW